MSETDYYELQKQVEELREQRAQLEFRKKCIPLQHQLKQAQAMLDEFTNDVSKITETVVTFNRNTTEIEEKLQNTNYLHVDRSAAVHLKSINKKAFQMLANPVMDIESSEKLFENDADRHKNFMRKVDSNLQKYNEFCECSLQLLNDSKQLCFTNSTSREEQQNTECLENENMLMSNADDTIKTIVSENVYTSSPLPFTSK